MEEGELNYEELDPGIRELVRWLRSLGFDTCDSGDGESKPQERRFLDFQHVFIIVKEPQNLIEECLRLQTMLKRDHGIELKPSGPDEEGNPEVGGSFDPANRLATIEVYHIEDSMLRRPS